MNNALVLVIEDEPKITKIIETYLQREGFRTVSAGDGHVGLSHHAQLNPDLVLLDIRLPDLDGYEVLSAIRNRAATPVIMVTALDEDLDKLQALRIGADDYIVKPFNPLEVVARVKSVLRRTLRKVSEPVIRVGPLAIHPTAHIVTIETAQGRKAIDLTPTEFRILAHMARSPQRVFQRAELVDTCLSEGDAFERTVDSHISNLRRKLVSAGALELLASIRGVGYRLGRADV